MTIHLGDVPASSTLYIPFASYGKTNGESITLTGLAVTDIEIYKNGSTTQRSSDNGYTLLDTDGIDFDGITGIHGFSVDLSDNTDAGFYAVGSFYWVIVSTVTIDSQTVSFIAATFRIRTAEAVTGKPKVDVDAWLWTAAATPTVNGVPEVDVTHWIGTAAATPTTAGVPEVDITFINGVAAGAVNISKTTQAICRGTVGSASTTTSIVTSSFNPAGIATDQFKGRIVTFDIDTTTTALRGQSTDITASSISATPTLTVTALTNAPASGDSFSIT